MYIYIYFYIYIYLYCRTIAAYAFKLPSSCERPGIKIWWQINFLEIHGHANLLTNETENELDISFFHSHTHVSTGDSSKSSRHPSGYSIFNVALSKRELFQAFQKVQLR